MQRVHITFCTLRPFSQTATFCRFGLKVRLVLFLDQGRLRPKVVFLPQTLHVAMIKSFQNGYIIAKIVYSNRQILPQINSFINSDIRVQTIKVQK
jgi:hypothetical protein